MSLGNATLIAFHRFCTNQECPNCPLDDGTNSCTFKDYSKDKVDIDTINDIVVKWCYENPVKTRQSEFLKLVPTAKLDANDIVSICPSFMDPEKYNLFPHCKSTDACRECRRKYWLREIK